jgi:anti-sigma factor RsiW
VTDEAPDQAIDGAIEDPIDDATIARVSDYLDGTLPDADRAEVERKIAEDATWQRAHAELRETRTFLSGLQKAHAPPQFTEGVTETIHRRSAGT